jgi:hypothetical protein
MRRIGLHGTALFEEGVTDLPNGFSDPHSAFAPLQGIESGDPVVPHFEFSVNEQFYTDRVDTRTAKFPRSKAAIQGGSAPKHVGG